MLRLASGDETVDQEIIEPKFDNFSSDERPVLLAEWTQRKFEGFQAPVSVALLSELLQRGAPLQVAVDC